MNVAATLSLATAAIAICVGALSIRISDAPGARDQRRFWVVAASTAAYSLCNLVTTVRDEPRLVVAASSVQVAAALVQAWGWLRYGQAFVERRPGRAERVLCAALLAAAAAALVPGLVLDGSVSARSFPALGAVYREASTTAFGKVLVAAGMASTAPVLARFFRAWRAGVPHAGMLAAAVAMLAVLAANDALAMVRATDGPYLLDVGFAAPVLAVGWVITSRFVEASRALEQLRGRLAAEVEARSNDLAAALRALHQAERLAALGQFASAVAHEVNSPAAVVMTNLHYLEEARARRAFPADADEVLADALASMKRINDLVRNLVDAGRIAASPGAPAPVRVADVAASASAQARARLPSHVALAVQVPGDLYVRGRRESIAQVLEHLVAHAGQVLPPAPGVGVELRAARAGASVRIVILAHGPGTAQGARRPEPAARPAGRDGGVGVALARSLVEAHGGTVELGGAPGDGSTAIVDLPAAPAPTPPPRTPVPDR